MMIRHWQKSLVLVLGLCGSSLGHASDINDSKLHQLVSKATAKELHESNTPSLQIAIGVGNKIVLEEAYGLSDIENSVNATSQTKYRTASVAKWFTATAAIRLAEEGVLKLDEPIHTYCSQFPEKKWPITSRQLLTHTAGIRHYVDYEEMLNSAAPGDEDKLTIKQLTDNLSLYTRYTDVITPLDTFKDDPLVFQPGSDWMYSSFGYRLLACVMEGAADQPYRELLQTLVFTPAKMNNTLADDAWEIIPNRASGYRVNRDKSVRRADMRDVSENLPAGGYLSTATDLVKFAMAFNNGLVTAESAQLMSTPFYVDKIDAASPPSWRDAIPSEDKYGYGLMLWSKYDEGMYGHTGRQAGASSIVIWSPKQQIAIAVMTNAKGWNNYLPFSMKIKSIVEMLSLLL